MNQHHRHDNDAIDPVLDARLDEALGQPRVPDGLEDRVLVATLPLLADRRPQRGVLARIGGSGPAWALAAVVALVAAVVLLVDTSPDVPGGHAGPTTSQIEFSDEEERELLALLAAGDGPPQDWIDQRLAVLAGPADNGDDLDWLGVDDPIDDLLDSFEAESIGTDRSRLF